MENKKLRKENEHLKSRLAKAEIIINVQKKVLHYRDAKAFCNLLDVGKKNMIGKPAHFINASSVEEGIEKRKLDEELAIAAEIQQRLLPQEALQLADYRVVGFTDPCQKIGGDYYDFVKKNPDTYCVLVADISGKGISAALLMSYLQATIRAMIEKIPDMQEMICSLNEVTYKNTPANKYLTLFYCELNTKRHELTYVNAGHFPPLLVKGGGEYLFLNSNGPVIGLLRSQQYQKATLSLQPEDLLVLYTDGVTERCNVQGEEFGTERLARLMIREFSTPLEDVVEKLRREIHQFCPITPCSDDVTAVLLKRIL